jgi:hypothetical protein
MQAVVAVVAELAWGRLRVVDLVDLVVAELANQMGSVV